MAVMLLSTGGNDSRANVLDVAFWFRLPAESTFSFRRNDVSTKLLAGPRAGLRTRKDIWTLVLVGKMTQHGSD